jgi:hypothetical protein
MKINHLESILHCKLKRRRNWAAIIFNIGLVLFLLAWFYVMGWNYK